MGVLQRWYRAPGGESFSRRILLIALAQIYSITSTGEDDSEEVVYLHPLITTFHGQVSGEVSPSLLLRLVVTLHDAKGFFDPWKKVCPKLVLEVNTMAAPEIQSRAVHRGARREVCFLGGLC